MLSLFTRYLIQYKRVCIPYIGTFEIVQQSPQLNFADKLLTAPVFTTYYQKQEALSDHQVNFFAASSSQFEKEQLREELALFGKKLKYSLKQQPLNWKGFGTIIYSSDEIIFEPFHNEFDALGPVAAEKVMRGHDAHKIVVGDHQITSGELKASELKSTRATPVKKVSWPVLIGWIILVLAIIAIIYVLIHGNFQPSSAGLNYKLP